jgi:gamma-glutamylcyclotransferase (GGCT)/AIG2-like uncharacterized protein YtfP
VNSIDTSLFVYGTLRRDPTHELFHVLARNAVFIGEATVEGRLFDLGDYPGMLFPAPNGHVVGEVYEVRPALWERVITTLDEYEACRPVDPQPHEYRRQLIPARLKSGRVVNAWAYILDRPASGLREIPSGDYLAWRDGARV